MPDDMTISPAQLADVPAAAEPAPAPAPKRKAAMVNPYTWAVGRRKTAVARVRIKPGAGQFMINDRKIDEYFLVDHHRFHVRQPLTAVDASKSWDVFVNVNGGGITGQAGAVTLGLARALLKADAAYEAKLRDLKLLTRDPRKVERKKYGRSGARRRFQFSKR